jgi:hypothetical protein
VTNMNDVWEIASITSTDANFAFGDKKKLCN